MSPLAWTFILLFAGMIVILFLLYSLAKKYNKRPIRIVGLGCLAFVVLFLAHPWLLGLPGRIASMRFSHGLHVGMTKQEVQVLEDKIESRSAQEAMHFGPEAPLDVNFATVVSFCAAGGVQYALHYDKSQHLTSWTFRDWTDGC